MTVQGQDTRTDLVFKHRSGKGYLVAECKRANPALLNWCFLRAPGASKAYIVDRILAYQNVGLRVDPAEITYNETFHIGLELRTGEKGEPHSSGRGAIEDALKQVMRGANGLVNFFLTRPKLIPLDVPAFILPVIFTTATLWTSSVDLNKADLETGKVDTSKHPLQKVDWLCYQYQSGPGLKHSAEVGIRAPTLGAEVQNSYTRTVAIVSPEGVDDFLQQSSLLTPLKSDT